MSVYGRRYWKSNGTLFPYDPANNYRTEVIAQNIQQKPLAGLGFSPIRQAIKLRQNQGRQSPMFALALTAVYFPEANIYFNVIFVAGIVNASNHLLGYSLYSMGVDKAVRRLLESAPRSQTGQSFLVDGSGFIFGTTHPTRFYNVTVATATTVPPNGCSNTYTTVPNVNPPRVNCRYYLSDFPYAPLRTLTKDFIEAKTLTSITVDADGEQYLIVSDQVILAQTGMRSNVIVVVPRADLLGDVENGRNIAIGVALGIVVIAIFITVLVSISVLRPLESIAHKMLETASLQGLDRDEELEDDEDDGNNNNNNDGSEQQNDSNKQLGNNNSSIDINDTSLKSSSTLMSFNTASSKPSSLHHNHPEAKDKNKPLERSWISEIELLEKSYTAAHHQIHNFTRYVSKAIVIHLITVGAATREMNHLSSLSVLYVDLANFTSLTETLDPKTLSNAIHLFFSQSIRLVMASGGIVDKLIGDCLVGNWNLFQNTPRHELLTALCALSIQRETTRDPLKGFWSKLVDPKTGETVPPLAVRVGLASGPGLAGNIGSNDRITYTVLGETNQTANSLEPFNKPFGTTILCSEEVARECNEELVLRLISRAKLPGRASPCLVYEILGVVPDINALTRKKSGDESGNSSSAGSSSSSAFSQKTAGTFESEAFFATSSPTSSPSSPFGSSLSSESKIDLSKMLKWHSRRTICDEKSVLFAQSYSDAVRSLLDSDFTSCLAKLKEIQTSDGISLNHKTHKSIGILKKVCEVMSDKSRQHHDDVRIAGNYSVSDLYCFEKSS